MTFSWYRRYNTGKMVYRYFVELKRKSGRSRATGISRTYAIVVLYKFYENKTIKTMTVFQLIVVFPLLIFEWFDRALVILIKKSISAVVFNFACLMIFFINRSFPVPTRIVWKKVLHNQAVIVKPIFNSMILCKYMLSAAHDHVCAYLFLLR